MEKRRAPPLKIGLATRLQFADLLLFLLSKLDLNGQKLKASLIIFHEGFKN